MSSDTNKYKYNGKEWQDELELNTTAMDFRQYDPTIGRFVGMDRLSELAYSKTPYRFAFNNPVYWCDPTGLFETKDEAKKWAKANGINTGWFSRNKIQKSEDGTWAVNNKKAGTSHFAVNASDAEALGVNAGDVVASALVVVESTEYGGDMLDLTIWGKQKTGDSSGREGTVLNSLNSNDFVTPSTPRSLNNNTTGFWEWLGSFFYNSISSYQKAITIQEAVTKNGNTSTMEVQNLEPVPTDTIISIKETQYTIYINPYSGERIVTPRISIERDTTINKLNIEQVRRAEKEKNNINYNNAK